MTMTRRKGADVLLPAGAALWPLHCRNQVQSGCLLHLSGCHSPFEERLCAVSPRRGLDRNDLKKAWRHVADQEEDFNKSPKKAFGCCMMDSVQSNGGMQDEIFSEKGRTSGDDALEKVLIYDIYRQGRITMGLASVHQRCQLL